MNRRDLLTLAGATATLHTITNITTAHGQQKADHSDGVYRRQTGRVDLLISGQRAKPLKTGIEILQAARMAKFYEDGRHRLELEGGAAEFVPADLPPSSIAQMIVEGLIVHKFIVTGSPKTLKLGAGTFYCFLNFVEGPDFDAGRWIGRIVDESGRIKSVVNGVEVRQVIHLHVDEQTRQRHSRPSIEIHKFAPPDVEKQLFDRSDDPPPTPPWVVHRGDWVALPPGCSLTMTCMPLLV